jgi:hypothetical protein
MRCGNGFCGNYALKKKGILLYDGEKLFIYFIPLKFSSLKFNNYEKQCLREQVSFFNVLQKPGKEFCSPL